MFRPPRSFHSAQEAQHYLWVCPLCPCGSVLNWYAVSGNMKFRGGVGVTCVLCLSNLKGSLTTNYSVKLNWRSAHAFTHAHTFKGPVFILEKINITSKANRSYGCLKSLPNPVHVVPPCWNGFPLLVLILYSTVKATKPLTCDLSVLGSTLWRDTVTVLHCNFWL